MLRRMVRYSNPFLLVHISSSTTTYRRRLCRGALYWTTSKSSTYVIVASLHSVMLHLRLFNSKIQCSDRLHHFHQFGYATPNGPLLKSVFATAYFLFYKCLAFLSSLTRLAVLLEILIDAGGVRLRCICY